ncbi:MAG: hypothetical protein HKN23_05835 [Verrucomicrobiales bacterium]|nr:hypothetical protein [Verrucomicrobiales bacterium]
MKSSGTGNRHALKKAGVFLAICLLVYPIPYLASRTLAAKNIAGFETSRYYLVPNQFGNSWVLEEGLWSWTTTKEFVPFRFLPRSSASGPRSRIGSAAADAINNFLFALPARFDAALTDSYIRF